MWSCHGQCDRWSRYSRAAYCAQISPWPFRTLLKSNRAVLLNSVVTREQLLFAAMFLDNLFRQRRGQFGIVRKMHSKGCTALRTAAQVGGITKHLCQRNFHANHVAARTAFCALNGRTPRV